MSTRAQRWLPRFALLTLALLYLVVLAGSVVRATGSGMGCPDWPRCYGRLIPPTSAEGIDFSKLDLDKYRRAWASHGRAAMEVTPETVIANFSAKETWIEFINRCLGALSGLAALGTLICALLNGRDGSNGSDGFQRVPRGWLLLLLLAQLVLFGVTAWLGKVVVDTNLLPWKITLHMLLALALITTALLARHWTAQGGGVPVTRGQRRHLWLCAALILTQVIVGTQVREAVDHLAAGQCCDGRLDQHLGTPLLWHRAGAIATLTCLALAFFRLKFSPAADAAAPVLITLLGLLVALEYGAGVLLVQANLPALLQPVHLVLAFALHGIVFALLMRCRLQSADPAPTPAAHE